MKIYEVGGAVRDDMLGLPVQDHDYVVVGATVEEMIQQGFKPVGNDFPVFLHPTTHEEYALARTERKQGTGYKGFVVHAASSVSLEEDLKRRDLTINAMARTLDGQLIDPYGGAKDCQLRLLRHVSDAFKEDPVRVLRVARFASRFKNPFNFQVAPETMALMRDMSDSGELAYLVPERVWQELAKGLMENTPSEMFHVLNQSHALFKILPIEEELWRTTQDELLLFLDQLANLQATLAERYAGWLMTLFQHIPQADKPILTLSQQLKVPKDCRDLALISWEMLKEPSITAPETAGQLLALIEKYDGIRRHERFHVALKLVLLKLKKNQNNLSSHPLFAATLLLQKMTLALDPSLKVEEKILVIKEQRIQLLKTQLGLL